MMDELNGKIIKLDDEVEYYIIDTILYKGEKYFYIASKDKPPVFKFLHYKDEEMFLVEDSSVIKELLLLVANN